MLVGVMLAGVMLVGVMLVDVTLASTALVAAAPAGAYQPEAGAGYPQRLIVLTPNRILLMRGELVVAKLTKPPGPIRLDTIVATIGDPTWASISADGVVRLRSALVQRPDTELRIGAPVRRVVLVDSPSSPAYLFGTRARVRVTGVSIVSQSASGSLAASSWHRPYLRYINQSTVTMRAAEFRGLGAPLSGRRGVTVGSDSTLDAVNVTFRDSTRGLDVNRALSVSLVRVAAVGNGEGITIHNARTIRLAQVQANANRVTGLVLQGPSRSLSVADVAARRNGHAGVELSELGAQPVGPFTTDHNGRVGVMLRQCPNCMLTGLAATAEQTAALLSTSPGAVVDRAKLADVVVGVELDTRCRDHRRRAVRCGGLRQRRPPGSGQREPGRDRNRCRGQQRRDGPGHHRGVGVRWRGRAVSRRLRVQQR
jgi:hypothetical protein